MGQQSKFTNNMGIEVITYSHTDYSDVWEPFLSRFRKYFPDTKIYFCVNYTDQELPHDVTPVFYEESKCYTQRLSQCLSQITSRVVLFLHEDMILYDTPLYDKLEDYTRYVEEGKAHSIKLIPVGTILARPEIDASLAYTTYSKFSIQPTIIHTDSLLRLLEEAGDATIWEFESIVKQRDTDYVSYLGTEDKRGMYHFDSKVFPYTATAIVKGKWNFSEYSRELKEVLAECSIDINVRGIV